MDIRTCNHIEVTFEVDENNFVKIGDRRYKREDCLSDEEYEDSKYLRTEISMQALMNLNVFVHFPKIDMINYKEFVFIFDLNKVNCLEKDFLELCQMVEDWLNNVKVLKFNDNQDLIFPNNIQEILDKNLQTN